MTYAATYPALTPIDHKIKLLLVMQGYKRDDIQFILNPTGFEATGLTMLRVGHWDWIKDEDISYIQEHCPVEIEDVRWYDEDCGWQSVYYFKTKEKITHGKNTKL